jgi:hypothetical protein
MIMAIMGEPGIGSMTIFVFNRLRPLKKENF